MTDQVIAQTVKYYEVVKIIVKFILILWISMLSQKWFST